MTEEVSRHNMMAERTLHRVTQHGSAVELCIAVDERDRFAIIQAMAGCDRVNGACGSQECNKAANVELDYRDGELVLKLAPKKNVSIEPDAMDKCGAWLARVSRHLCQGRWPWWKRWPCRILQKLGWRR